jgi:hypothetical protein
MTRISNQQLIKDYLLDRFRDLRVRLHLYTMQRHLSQIIFSYYRALHYTLRLSLDSCSAWTPSGYVLN